MPTVGFPEIANNAITLLDGAISDSATSFDVDSAAALGFTDSTTDAYITVIDPTNYRKNPSTTPETLEIMQVTGVSSNTLTVTRGVDGTSGTAFPDNSIVELRITAAMIQRIYDALTDGNDDLNIGALTAAGDVSVPTGFINIGSRDQQTISSGAITATQTNTSIEPETGTADDLDTINGGTDGDIIIIRPHTFGDTITVKHGTGNIYLNAGADEAMNNRLDRVMLVFDGVFNYWVGVSESNNA